MEGRALKVNFPQSNREPRTNNFRSERPPRTEGGYGGASRGGSYNNPNNLHKTFVSVHCHDTLSV